MNRFEFTLNFGKKIECVFKNLNDKIIQELKNKNLGFCFFNLNKEFIKGFKYRSYRSETTL